jgi:predicted PurR-regulated permease PerM
MTKRKLLKTLAKVLVGLCLVIGVAVAVVLYVLWVARHVISWLLIALFLALAINPAVEWLHRRGHMGRGKAVAVIYLGVLLGVGLLVADDAQAVRAGGGHAA